MVVAPSSPLLLAKDTRTWLSLVHLNEGLSTNGRVSESDRWFLFLGKDDGRGSIYEIKPHGASMRYEAPSIAVHLPDDTSSFSQFQMRSVTDEEVEVVNRVAERVEVPRLDHPMAQVRWCDRVILALVEEGLLDGQSILGARCMIGEFFLQAAPHLAPRRER